MNTAKKKWAFPHTYVIIVTLMVIAIGLTWVVPAGKFPRIKDEATGKMVVVAEGFKYVEQNPVSIFSLPYKIVKGLLKSAKIVFLVLIVGGAFNIIIETGMFQAFAGKLTKKFSKNDVLVIPAFTAIFAAACMTMGVNTFIGFAPVAVIIARSMGWDAVVGVSMVALGGAVGFSTGTFNPFTTGVAQSLAGLPLFSGLYYRLVSFAVFLVVTNVYIIAYARKIKKNPKLSAVYDLEQEYKAVEAQETAHTDTEKRHYLVLAAVAGLFALLIYGSTNWKWKLEESAALFIWMGIAAGAVYGFTPNKIATDFVNGAKKLVFGGLIIGIANGIAIILADGSILDTTVLGLSRLLVNLPPFLQSAGMFLMQLIINGLITSGSGQAAATMPIMLPVADIIGMTRQTTVLAFNFGDGLSNYILPTSSALMGFLAIAGIPYEKWMKFMWKLFLIWMVTGCALVMTAHAIHYGPF